MANVFRKSSTSINIENFVTKFTVGDIPKI